MAAPHAGQWRRPGPTARQRRADAGIALAVTAAAVLNLFLARSAGILGHDGVPGLPEQLAWVLATVLPLAWRRSQPEIVAVVVSAAYLGAQWRGAQEQQITSGVLFAAIYTLGAWGQDRSRVRVVRAGIIAVMFAYLVVSFVISFGDITIERSSGELPAVWSLILNTFILNIAYFAFVHLMGDAVWTNARHRHRIEEQASALRAAQELVAERAAVDERVRIARELHDVVAHHVSAMGIQASAARRALERDPSSPKARTALAAVEEGARTAVDELRRMLGALRSSAGATPGPSAGIDRVPEIVDRARESGLTVDFGIYGDAAPLPDSLSQAAYRIVQEAVTNTLKHAGATALDIRIRYLRDEIELDVADDGRAAPAGTGGMGLIGMRERVAVHDGALEYGPRTREPGFRVRARLPLAGRQ
ncbi:sensor histidine kinase [Actinoplanes sp. NBRC 101535]|uniref:sensor histidine kinase n=1 Tax=Actinoplanes sp. NBRC 101535 TaxID=3032196 RepID=UPI0024A3D9CA|nr:sensor histidine kinase [Actinoplanes sp. NBRC 101535]GLY04821.1 two-component sensor histidine kinase [Actinoplanes sp. NBRC 101535]